MKQAVAVSVILLFLLGGCFGYSVKSESAQALEDFQKDIDSIGKKVGAVFGELQEDTYQLADKKITEEQMISRVGKKVEKLKKYKAEFDEITPPPLYQEAYNYMQSGLQKSVDGMEMMHRGMSTDDASLVQPVMDMMTAAAQDITTAKTLIASATQQVMPSGKAPSTATAQAMSQDEYKSFVRSMDSRINNAMTRVDTGIKEYREKTRTEQEFISDIDYAISELETVVDAFTTAAPPIELVSGHVLAVEGANYMKEGFAQMKTAMQNKDNEAYKQAVQQFSIGLKKLQDANAEYKSKIQGGFAMTLGNI